MKYMVHYKPNRDYMNLWNDFDALLGNIFESGSSIRGKEIAVDIRDSEHAYIIEAELPGFNESEIDVKVEDGILSISASREENKGGQESGEGKQYLVRERRSESFRRSFSLPKDVDVEKIDGNYKNGVLTLSLQKKPETKPKSIKVKAA